MDRVFDDKDFHTRDSMEWYETTFIEFFGNFSSRFEMG